MNFRHATMDDADLIYAWRQHEEAADWYQGAPTTEGESEAWLKKRLGNPLVKILIWLEDGTPCGVARRDSNDELTFYATTDEAAGRMLAEIVAQTTEKTKRIKAVLDVGDPRVGQLERAGFQVYPATFLVYKP